MRSQETPHHTKIRRGAALNSTDSEPTHHFALGVGHHAAAIQKIANYLNIESVIID